MAVAMTAAEKVRDAKIRELGCIACYVQFGVLGTPTSVHHITVRGRRKGHKHTIPLCPGHHKDGDKCACKLPFHHNKKVFEAAYGTQEELFALTNKLIGYTDEMIANMVQEDPTPVAGLRQKLPKKPRKVVAKPPSKPNVPFVPKPKVKASPQPIKKPAARLSIKVKIPKPSPEVVARQKAAQKEAKERYLQENADKIEAMKEKAKERSAEMRRTASQRVSMGKTKGPKISPKIMARNPGQFY